MNLELAQSQYKHSAGYAPASGNANDPVETIPYGKRRGKELRPPTPALTLPFPLNSHEGRRLRREQFCERYAINKADFEQRLAAREIQQAREWILAGPSKPTFEQRLAAIPPATHTPIAPKPILIDFNKHTPTDLVCIFTPKFDGMLKHLDVFETLELDDLNSDQVRNLRRLIEQLTRIKHCLADFCNIVKYEEWRKWELGCKEIGDILFKGLRKNKARIVQALSAVYVNGYFDVETNTVPETVETKQETVAEFRQQLNIQEDDTPWESLTDYEKYIEVLFTPQYFNYIEDTHGPPTYEASAKLVNPDDDIIYIFFPTTSNTYSEPYACYLTQDNIEVDLYYKPINPVYNLKFLEEDWESLRATRAESYELDLSEFFYDVGSTSKERETLYTYTRLLFTIPQFDGTNYKKWSDAIRAFLRYQGVWYLVQGYGFTATVPVPGLARPIAATGTPTATEIAAQAAWDEKNDKALGII
ncbi:uncharacterized protein PHACADRAFT_202096 [Phanerochaete carnosa HHB-10118-sp]|uniref:Uncharacterized protein n=1 Tax=Phanerochaete carnosa (strain HHB-10118-sp) TaxID=650164 RepID=K5VQL7_PHACS|nr:uncharacterized protein PHACADRAFT_202096 [Phanerochaete carnosa HHB-10118-sp]EKM49035.1 hypothetical protein PHACADRAFT_202096 [Phanerochaete carnosa HHB-10118-sp]